MKKKKKPILQFHNECLKTGKLTEGLGLCSCSSVSTTYAFDLISTITPEELWEHMKEYGCYYWGKKLEEPHGLYNDFRQTIVLLCAAIEGEL